MPTPRPTSASSRPGSTPPQGDTPILQRLGDLLAGCRPPAGVQVTNPKTRPGRLQDVLPASLLHAFCGYIEALGQVEPAVLAADGLVYAPEIKYYAYQVPVDPDWQSTDIAGLRQQPPPRIRAALLPDERHRVKGGGPKTSRPDRWTAFSATRR